MRIEAKHLIKIYGDRSVVNDISFEMNKGEVVCLLGPNGAGKTTTFYMVVGLVKPNKGQILLDGEDITAWPMNERAKAGIGYLPQEASIFRKLTVEDNIKLVLEMNDKLTVNEKKRKLEELLSEFGILRLRSYAGVLITDHNPKATLSITDRAYVIFDGKIKIQGRSVDVANDPVAKEFYLGKDFAL